MTAENKIILEKTNPLGKSKQGIQTANKPREDSKVKTLKKWRKNTVVKKK
jgi:hypothetical protein